MGGLAPFIQAAGRKLSFTSLVLQECRVVFKISGENELTSYEMKYRFLQEVTTAFIKGHQV